MLQGLRLAFQIDLGVAVGCPEGGVSQPCADRVDIDADAEEVHGRGMTHGVRVDALVVADVKARLFAAIRHKALPVIRKCIDPGELKM